MMKGDLDLGVSLCLCTPEEARVCKAVCRPSINSLFSRKRCFFRTFYSEDSFTESAWKECRALGYYYL